MDPLTVQHEETRRLSLVSSAYLNRNPTLSYHSSNFPNSPFSGTIMPVTTMEE